MRPRSCAGSVFVSVRGVKREPLRILGVLWACAAAALSGGCGDNGLLPSTVDPGQDFSIADVVYDEDFFYCRVEPAIFGLKCGSGDPAQGDPSGGCHFNVTSYRLTNYSPLLGDSCNGNHPTAGAGPEAQKNYETSQAKMSRDPQSAPLLIRPSGRAAHPRVVVDPGSSDAQKAQLSKQFVDAVTEWANKSQ